MSTLSAGPEGLSQLAWNDCLVSNLRQTKLADVSFQLPRLAASCGGAAHRRTRTGCQYRARCSLFMVPFLPTFRVPQYAGLLICCSTLHTGPEGPEKDADWLAMRGTLQCEVPNADLHAFKGRFNLTPKGGRADDSSWSHPCTLSGIITTKKLLAVAPAIESLEHLVSPGKKDSCPKGAICITGSYLAFATVRVCESQRT